MAAQAASPAWFNAATAPADAVALHNARSIMILETDTFWTYCHHYLGAGLPPQQKMGGNCIDHVGAVVGGLTPQQQARIIFFRSGHPTHSWAIFLNSTVYIAFEHKTLTLAAGSFTDLDTNMVANTNSRKYRFQGGVLITEQKVFDPTTRTTNWVSTTYNQATLANFQQAQQTNVPVIQGPQTGFVLHQACNLCPVPLPSLRICIVGPPTMEWTTNHTFNYGTITAGLTPYSPAVCAYLARIRVQFTVPPANTRLAPLPAEARDAQGRLIDRALYRC